MDKDLLIKIGTLLVGLPGAAKLIYDLSVGRKNRMQEEYRFAKEFLGDINSPVKLHPFLREKGYRTIAGDRRFRPDEIEYLLSLSRPDLALRDYVLGFSYLEHISTSGNLQVRFKKRYRKAGIRLVLKVSFVLFYGFFASLAFSPLVLSGIYINTPLDQTLMALSISMLVFGYYSIVSLKSFMKIYRAEKLVANQEKHTQQIFVSLPSKPSEIKNYE